MIVLISAGPLVLDIPRQIKTGLQSGRQVPHWPPYYPVALNTRLAELTRDQDAGHPYNEIIVSDQPWAVAWYADRRSIWLPKRLEDFRAFEDLAREQGSPVVGILVTPYSHSTKPLFSVYREYSEFAPLILDGWATETIKARKPGILTDESPKIKAILARYAHPIRFVNNWMIYWSSQPAYSPR